VDLPAERKLTRQIPAQSPTDLVKHELQFKESVLLVLGIPPAMIMTESANGKVVHNTNAEQMHRQHLTGMKQRLMPVLQIVLRYIYNKFLLFRHLATTTLHKHMTWPSALASQRIVISMPGIPPQEVFFLSVINCGYFLFDVGAVRDVLARPPQVQILRQVACFNSQH
jgi:hypothetical protein